MKKPAKFKQSVEFSTQPAPVNSKRAERAILKTLSYRSMFSFPLTVGQLQNYLITKKPVSRLELEMAITELESKKRIKRVGDCYCLKNTDTVDARERSKNAQELIEKARTISKTLSRIPWVKFVGVTGSVAAFNAQKDDDIDILIIADQRRLWLTRGFVFVILKILDELRTDKTPGQKICPNILIDDGNLGWPKRSRNIYVAHEVVMLYPIHNRDETYLKFLEANSWVLRFFGNLKFNSVKSQNSRKHSWNIIDIVENISRSLQLNYMSAKKTTEVTKDNMIHFNRDDHTKRFLSEFEKIKTAHLK